MSKFLFIINPIAGGGKAKGLLELIENIMEKYEEEFEIKWTSRPKEATSIVEENIDKYDIMVAVGGDGTVNEVARGLINLKRGTLGIIPGGTGNDLAKSLNIPLNPSEALEILCKGKDKPIDMGNVNGFNFLNIASVGFDAEVVLNNIKIKEKIRSSISYAISVIHTLGTFKNKRVKITIDDKSIEENIMLLAVGNGKYYGGGMKILPTAEINDGYLDICIISKVCKLKLLFLFPTIFSGKHTKYKKYVQIHRAKKICVKSDEGIYINIDGEVLPTTEEISFFIEKDKLNIRCEER